MVTVHNLVNYEFEKKEGGRELKWKKKNEK